MTGARRADKIAVIGAGVVGVPMAALLAEAGRGTTRVVIIQRPSVSSGWKIAALNAGRNPLGGVEPGLEDLIAGTGAEGTLRASSDMGEARDAAAILVCVQTDKKGLHPDYGPLFGALDELAVELRRRPAGPRPLVIIESTLAPTSMASDLSDFLAARGLQDGESIDLGFSPNRVMPGHLLERIRGADKIVSGLRPATAERIRTLYAGIVIEGQLHATNTLTAEIVKTLENAARDVRIAFAVEVARTCDEADVDFHRLRAEVNARLNRRDRASVDPTAVPTGGLLVPTIGVGGHCLPKDGILLLWRMLESGADVSASLILEARRINDESPEWAADRIERILDPIDRSRIALLGTAYRPDTADTRNSPALALGRILARRARSLRLHDPYVRADDHRLTEYGLADSFTNDLEAALADAEIIVIGTAHAVYRSVPFKESVGPSVRSFFDGAHLFLRDEFAVRTLVYEGIGKGRKAPSPDLAAAVEQSFRAVETGLANEVGRLIEFLNDGFASGEAERTSLETVRFLASTCTTGCALAEPGPVGESPVILGRSLRLPALAARVSGTER
jgi:UDP-N-acetyl-D-mannosaminuronic acid dehydrogenase